MTSATPGPSPGWYPDPPGSNNQRYWDGEAWTDQIAPIETAGFPERDPRNDGLAGWGWIFAIGIPIIGLLIGLMLLSRNDRRGGNIALAAVLLGSFYYLLLASLA